MEKSRLELGKILGVRSKAPLKFVFMENQQPELPAPLYAGLGLTDQELLICRLVCAVDEPTTAAVAYAANIASSTANRHMEKLHNKLGVHTRGGLMRRAIELGIVNYCCARCVKPLTQPPQEPPAASAP